MFNSSLRKLLGVSSNTSIKTICETLGIENLDQMIIKNYKGLIDQINNDKKMKQNFELMTRNIKEEISLRIRNFSF